MEQVMSQARHRDPTFEKAGGRLILAATLFVVAGGCTAIREYRARRYVDRADALLEVQDLDAALEELEAAAQIAPQLAVAHSRMGVVYRRKGDYEQAIDCFVEAIRRAPFSFDDTFNLAQLYYFTDHVKNAIQAYLHAVGLKPQDFDAQLNLGVCYQQMGDLDQAVERFQAAIDIDPNRPHAYINLGVALDAQHKYYEAIRAYKEALERTPPGGLPASSDVAGWPRSSDVGARFEVGNRSPTFEKAGQPAQPLVLVNLAHTYMHQGRLKMARHSLEGAIRMDPELAVAHEALGYCLFRMKDFDEAERSYKQALAYDWRLPRAHAGLGSINMLRYLKDNALTRRQGRALEHWHRSLELNPDQPRIHKLIARYKPEHSDPEEVLLSARSSG